MERIKQLNTDKLSFTYRECLEAVPKILFLNSKNKGKREKQMVSLPVIRKLLDVIFLFNMSWLYSSYI